MLQADLGGGQRPTGVGQAQPPASAPAGANPYNSTYDRDICSPGTHCRWVTRSWISELVTILPRLSWLPRRNIVGWSHEYHACGLRYKEKLPLFSGPVNVPLTMWTESAGLTRALVRPATR